MRLTHTKKELWPKALSSVSVGVCGDPNSKEAIIFSCSGILAVIKLPVTFFSLTTAVLIHTLDPCEPYTAPQLPLSGLVCIQMCKKPKGDFLLQLGGKLDQAEMTESCQQDAVHECVLVREIEASQCLQNCAFQLSVLNGRLPMTVIISLSLYVSPTLHQAYFCTNGMPLEWYYGCCLPLCLSAAVPCSKLE